MKKWIPLSLGTALCFSFAGPLVKLGFNNGLRPNGYILSYVLGLAIIMLTSLGGGPAAWYPNPRALAYGMAAGFLCALGFKLNSDALAITGSSVALITLVVGTYPALTSLISIPLFKEQVLVPRFMCGMTLLLAAMYLILTSEKTSS